VPALERVAVEPTDDRPVVLHVITRFAYGGSEQRLLDLVAALPELRHVVLVGTLSAPERLATVPAEPVLLPSLTQPLTPIADAKALRSIWQLLRRLRPALLITHQSKASALGRLAGRFGGLRGRALQSLSMSALDEAKGGAQRRAFVAVERLLGRWTSTYLCVGHDLADQYQRELALRPDRFEVVRSTVRLDAFRSGAKVDARRALRLGSEPVLVYVGSFDARKGVDQLPAILAAVRSEIGPLTALLVGDGPLHDDVIRDASKIEGVDVRAPGHVAEVAPFMRAADVLCLPSRSEGLPQVLVQAAAADLPFVAYDVAGVHELLRMGAAGMRIDLGDVAAMAAALAGFLDHAVTEPAHPVDLAEWDPEFVRARYRELVLRALA
jgi:glycosyltransferase involved in cell wall biosynthesis